MKLAPGHCHQKTFSSAPNATRTTCLYLQSRYSATNAATRTTWPTCPRTSQSAHPRTSQSAHPPPPTTNLNFLYQKFQWPTPIALHLLKFTLLVNINLIKCPKWLSVHIFSPYNLNGFLLAANDLYFNFCPPPGPLVFIAKQSRKKIDNSFCVNCTNDSNGISLLRQWHVFTSLLRYINKTF